MKIFFYKKLAEKKLWKQLLALIGLGFLLPVFIVSIEDYRRDFNLQKSIISNQEQFELLRKEGIVKQNEKLCNGTKSFTIEPNCVALTKKNTAKKSKDALADIFYKEEIEIAKFIILKDKSRVRILEEEWADGMTGAFSTLAWIYKVKLENGEEKYLFRETYGGKLLKEETIDTVGKLALNISFIGQFSNVLVNNILKTSLGWLSFLVLLTLCFVSVLNISLFVSSKFEELENKVFKNLFWKIFSILLKIILILITFSQYFLFLQDSIFSLRFTIILLIFVIILTIVIKTIKKKGIKC